MEHDDFDRFLPSVFTVETTVGCNLQCLECPVGCGKLVRKKGAMDFSRFKIIADKIKPFAKYLLLHNWGEPLLNKDIFRIIQYSSEFVGTNISTNGQNMTEIMAKKLIESGVADIIVSIDGMTQETYEKYRVKGNLDKALQALKWLHHYNVKCQGSKWLRRLKKKISIPCPKAVNLIPQFIVFKHNEHEMKLFEEVSRSLNLIPCFKPPYVRDNFWLQSQHPDFNRSRYRGETELKRAMKECSSPREDFTILIDGSVVPCCYDYNCETTFGNIFEKDVMEIWNSPTYREFRRSIIMGNTPDFCLRNCCYYMLESNETHSEGCSQLAE